MRAAHRHPPRTSPGSPSLRHCVQRGSASSGAAAAPPAVRAITAHPPLELTAAHLCINRSGTYAAVAGSALEDPEISRIVVVDLTNCRPAPAHGGGGAAPAPPSGRHDVCEAVVLDPELFGSRPGLRVLQVAWHPDSDSHLAVLTSGEGPPRAELAPGWQTLPALLHACWPRGRCPPGRATTSDSWKARRLRCIGRHAAASAPAAAEPACIPCSGDTCIGAPACLVACPPFLPGPAAQTTLGDCTIRSTLTWRSRRSSCSCAAGDRAAEARCQGQPAQQGCCCGPLPGCGEQALRTCCVGPAAALRRHACACNACSSCSSTGTFAACLSCCS